MKGLLPLLMCLAIGLIAGLFLRPPRPAGKAVLEVPAVAGVKSTAFRRAITSRVQQATSPLDTLLKLLGDAGSHSRFPTREVLDLMTDLPLGDCRAVFEALSKTQSEARHALLVVLGQRWVDLDAADALAFAMELPAQHQRSGIGAAAAAALAESEPELVLARIGAATNRMQRATLAGWILPALAKRDPRRAVGYFESAPPEIREQHSLYYGVAAEFGRTAPAEAIAWAESLKSAGVKRQALSGVWAGWAEKDPKSAAAAVIGNAEVAGDRSIVSTVARNLSREDMPAALAWAQSLPEGEARETAYNSLQFENASITLEVASRVIGAMPTEEAAARMADRMGRELGGKNIQEAIAWAGSLSSEKIRNSFITAVVFSWSQTDPSAAMRFITSQPYTKQHAGVVESTVRSWSANEPDAAHAFVENLPPGPARDAALCGIVDDMEETDPAKVLNLFASVQDPDALSKLADRFVRRVAESDPEAAFEIVSQVPTNAQPQAFEALVSSWAPGHIEAAGEWLQGMPIGAARDSAVSAYVSVIDGKDAAAATRWAFSISEPMKRMEATYPAFERWLEKDREGARAWLHEANLPDGLRPFFEKAVADKDSP